MPNWAKCFFVGLGIFLSMRLKNKQAKFGKCTRKHGIKKNVLRISILILKILLRMFLSLINGVLFRVKYQPKTIGDMSWIFVEWPDLLYQVKKKELRIKYKIIFVHELLRLGALMAASVVLRNVSLR